MSIIFLKKMKEIYASLVLKDKLNFFIVPNSQKTDELLVSLTLNDPEVFGTLVERYENKLFRYIRRISGVNKESAEDILQEVFIKIYRNLNDFNADLSFSSWAYRITHNEAINHFRKSSKSQIIPLEINDPEEFSLINVLCDDLDLLHELSRKELSTKVQDVLSMLSLKYKEVLILKYLEDMSYEEISDVLKIPMGTVATLINRSKNQFKQIVIKNNIKF